MIQTYGFLGYIVTSCTNSYICGRKYLRDFYIMQSTFFSYITAAIFSGFIFGFSTHALAAVEFVTVVKILSNDDHGIIVRSNGDAYQIEKGVGCLSFWRYEGKQVIVSSPGLFLGVGSKLILSDDNQKCHIWDSKELGQWGGTSTEQPPKSSKRVPPKPASRNCIEGHWISSVLSNGQIVALEDRSVWEINAVDAVNTMLWLPTENVLICGIRMINSITGEEVTATRLK